MIAAYVATGRVSKQPVRNSRVRIVSTATIRPTELGRVCLLVLLFIALFERLLRLTVKLLEDSGAEVLVAPRPISAVRVDSRRPAWGVGLCAPEALRKGDEHHSTGLNGHSTERPEAVEADVGEDPA